MSLKSRAQTWWMPGRPFAEHPFRRIPPPAQRLGEHVALPPLSQDTLLERDEIEPRIDGIEGHGPTIPSTSSDPGPALPCPAPVASPGSVLDGQGPCEEGRAHQEDERHPGRRGQEVGC